MYILVKQGSTRYYGGVKVQTGFRLEDELVDKIDELASMDNRKRSNMVETLLYEAVLARDPTWKPRGADSRTPD